MGTRVGWRPLALDPHPCLWPSASFMSSVERPPNRSKKWQAPGTSPHQSSSQVPTNEGSPSGTEPALQFSGAGVSKQAGQVSVAPVPLGGSEEEGTAGRGGPGPAHTRHPAALRTHSTVSVTTKEVIRLVSLAGTSLKAAVTTRWGHSPGEGWQGLGPTQGSKPILPPIRMKAPDTSASDSTATRPPRALWWSPRAPSEPSGASALRVSTVPLPPSEKTVSGRLAPHPGCRRPQVLLEGRFVRPAVPSEVPRVSCSSRNCFPELCAAAGASAASAAAGPHCPPVPTPQLCRQYATGAQSGKKVLMWDSGV